MTNREIREWYLNELTKIPSLNRKWIKEARSLKDRARMAWEFRHSKRIEARSFMKNKGEVELLKQRDVSKYGTPDGPTLEFLLKQLKKDGLKGNDVFEAIIKGSYRTDAGVNRSLGF